MLVNALVDGWAVSRPQGVHNGMWRQYIGLQVANQGRWSLVTCRRPPDKGAVPDQGGTVAFGHERASGQVRQPGSKCPLSPEAVHTFGMEERVNISRTDALASQSISKRPSIPEALICLSPTFPTGAVSGRQGGGLIKKKQFRVAAGLHQRSVSAFELQLAGNPGRSRPSPCPELPLVIMEAAAIAHQGSACLGGDDFAKGRHPVLKRHATCPQGKIATRFNFSPTITQAVSWSTPPAAMTMRGMAMDLKRTVGKRVRFARKQAGLTQEMLAERIERAVETVSNLERGHTLPTLDTLERVSRALDVPIKDFFETDEGTSPRRAELRLQMHALLNELGDAEFSIAVGLVQVLATARGAGIPRGQVVRSQTEGDPDEDEADRLSPKRPRGTFPRWDE